MKTSKFHLDNLKTVEGVWDTNFLYMDISEFRKKGQNSGIIQSGLTKTETKKITLYMWYLMFQFGKL